MSVQVNETSHYHYILDDNMINTGAHNKNYPEITARVSNIELHSTWNGNLYNGPDAAVSIREVTKN